MQETPAVPDDEDDEAPLGGDALDALRAQLERRADALRAELKAVDSERIAAPTLTGDTVEDDAGRGEQRTRDAVRAAEQERDTTELRAIGAALARFDAGRYGPCEQCGRPIGLRRLQVQPSAARCFACQQRYERAHPPTLRVAAQY